MQIMLAKLYKYGKSFKIKSQLNQINCIRMIENGEDTE